MTGTDAAKQGDGCRVKRDRLERFTNLDHVSAQSFDAYQRHKFLNRFRNDGF